MPPLIPSQLYGPDDGEKPVERGNGLGAAALNLGRGVFNDLVAPAAEVMDEATGNQEGIYKDLSKIARGTAEGIDKLIPEERRKDRDAVFVPEGDERSVFKNPGSTLLMKASGAAPSVAAFIGAGPAAPVIGAAQAAGSRMSEVRGQVEKATEDELLKTYPKYTDYMTMGFPPDYARKLLIDDLLTGTMLPAMAGGAAGGGAISGLVRHSAGRGIIKGMSVGAAEGLAGGAAQGAGNEVSTQQGEMNVGKRVDYEGAPITRAAANMGLEMLTLGGGMGGIGGLRGKAGDWASKRLDEKKARDAAIDVDGNAPDPAQTDALSEGGKAPDNGKTAMDAEIDATAAASSDALNPTPAVPPVATVKADAPVATTAVPKAPTEAVIEAIHAAAGKRVKAGELHDALVKTLGEDAPSPTEVLTILQGMKTSGDVTKNASGYKTTRLPQKPVPVLEKTPIKIEEAVEAAKPPVVEVTKPDVPGDAPLAPETAALAADAITPPGNEVPQVTTKLQEQRAPKSLGTAPPSADALAPPVAEAPVKKAPTLKAKIEAGKSDTNTRFEKAYKEIFDDNMSRDEPLKTEAERHGLTEQEAKDGLNLASKVELSPEANAKLENLKAERHKAHGEREAREKAIIEKHGLRPVDYQRLSDKMHKLGDEAFMKEHDRLVGQTDITPLPAKEKAAPKAGTLTVKVAPKTEGEKAGVTVVSRKIPLTAADIKIRTAIKNKLTKDGKPGSDETARKVSAIVKKNMAREDEAMAKLKKLQDEAETKAQEEAKATGKPSVFKRTELPPETAEIKLARHVEQALNEHRENEADAKRTKRVIKKEANEEAAEALVRDTWTDENDKPRNKELAEEARAALGGDAKARESILRRVHNMLVLAAQKHIEIARAGFRTDRPEEGNSTPWRKYLHAADKFNKRVKEALNEKFAGDKAKEINEAFAEFLPHEHEMREGKGGEVVVEPTHVEKTKAEADELAEIVRSQKADADREAAVTREGKAGEETRDALDEQAAKDDGEGLNPDDYGDGRAVIKNGSEVMSDDFQVGSHKLIRDVVGRRVIKDARYSTLADHLDKVDPPWRLSARKLFDRVMELLRTHGADTHVFTIKDDVWASYGLDAAAGFYMRNHDVAKPGLMFLRESQATNSLVVVHEGVHAITIRAIEHDPAFEKSIQKFMDDTLGLMGEGSGQRASLEIEYGFHNPSEFVAEVFANPGLRAKLAELKLGKPVGTATGMLRTAWDKFVDLVDKLLGLKSRADRTALDEALRLADEAVARDADIRADAVAGQEMFDSAPRAHPSPVRDYFEERIPAKIDWKLRNQRMLDKVASVVQMTNNSDHLYGPDRPARLMAEAMGKMATMKDKILQEKAIPLMKKMATLQRKYDQRSDGRSKWTDFTSLAHDASLAGIHPEKGLDEQFKKDGPRNWYQREVYKNIRDRYDVLPQELKDTFHEATDYFRTTQNQMSLGLIRNTLRAASSDGKGSDALAQRIFDKKLTPADKVFLGKDGLLSAVTKAGALSRIEGPYVPFMRRGDFVVTGVHEVAAPAGARRINEDEKLDAKGNTYEFKTEDEAKKFVTETLVKRGLKPSAVDKLAIDPATDSHFRENAEGKKVALTNAETNMDTRWRVTIEPKHVEFHEKASHAAAAREGLVADPGMRDVTHVDAKKLDPTQLNDSFMPVQMQRLINGLEKREGFKKLDKNAQAELLKQLKEAGLAAMGSTRAQSHRLPRKNILGYSEDLLKNTQTYASSTAGYLARLRFRPDVDAALKQMTDYTDNMTRAGNDEYVTALRRQRLNELTKRAHSMNHVEQENMFHRVTSRLLQLSYLDKLASPAFHIINSAEPWTITMPVLAARHGLMTTVAHMTRAYNLIGGRTIVGAGLRDTVRAGKHGYAADLTNYRSTLTQRVAKDAEHGPELVKLMEHLHDIGLMARDAGMEMAAYADPSSTMAGRLADRGDLMARQVGAAIESINRAVTAVSAYKLERAKGESHKSAMTKATEVVHDTMKDYASWNAAPMFNHPVGRLALQFKKYAQGTYYLLGKTAVASFKGDKEAMKTFVGLMATHMLTAGALGMPLEAIRLGLMGANLLGATDKTYEDMEQGVRAGAANVFGLAGGEIFSRGAARWAGIDLSSRVSFANLATSGQDPKSMKADDLWAWLAKNLVGAPASLLMDGVQGFQALGKGEVEEASRLLVPLKVWADTVQAHQWATNGRKSPSGREQMAPISMGDAFIKSIGFTPGSVAERNEKTFAVKGDQRQFKDQRTKLANDWVNASPDEKTAMWREIEKWNAGQPANAKIKLRDLMEQKRRRDREKLSEDRVDGISTTKRDRHIRTSADYYNVPITH